MFCTVCRVDLPDSLQHYKSVWHSTNLKRKNQEMPPIDLQQFEQLSMVSQPSVEAWQCQYCDKTMKNEKRLNQHVKDCLSNLETALRVQALEERKEYEGVNTDYEQANSEEDNKPYEETAFDHSHEPYLQLPSGSILGNKRYLIYFKQKDQYRLNQRTQIVQLKDNTESLQSRRTIIENQIKLQVRLHKQFRFRMQWSQ
ncbi:hypothetical protein M153_100023306 [Pseudoloma neurophilia]|uniref:C2H2-type domain-containing protein n=1 Tax=Pseudoloma neurophilia TaxID=146866 RepID=A0A0R0M1K2_9MICR|nr:hypothetical protein M153_100023306 [Pseudoloma neurophilia]